VPSRGAPSLLLHTFGNHNFTTAAQVRIHDIATLEDIIETLLQGSIDAEADLSGHNYVQLYKILQLAVEHLWQLRPIQAKLYALKQQAIEAAARYVGIPHYSVTPVWT
jgi:hypothetical protein